MKANTITLPVSGLTLTVRRQPISVIQKTNQRAEDTVQRSIPRPVPPVQEVATGPNEVKHIANLSDPEYQYQLKKYNEAVILATMQEMSKIITHIGIVHDEDLREHLREAEKVQASYKELGYEVPEDLLEFALQYIIAPSQEDSSTLIYEVFGKSLPTSQQVAFKQAMFQSDIQETAD